MNFDTLIATYVVILVAIIGAIAAYYELRRKRFEPHPSRDSLFRCEKCSFVYTDDEDVDCSRCPQCGTMNEEIRF